MTYYSKYSKRSRRKKYKKFAYGLLGGILISSLAVFRSCFGTLIPEPPDGKSTSGPNFRPFATLSVVSGGESLVYEGSCRSASFNSERRYRLKSSLRKGTIEVVPTKSSDIGIYFGSETNHYCVDEGGIGEPEEITITPDMLFHIVEFEDPGLANIVGSVEETMPESTKEDL